MVLLEPTNLLLLACALIYLGLGEPAEASFLLVLVAGISWLDASQQRRSQRALKALARLAAPHVHLLRAGVELSVPPQQVRCGDLLRLEEGDRVAADARLHRAVGLWLDESLLTGESLPVARQAGDAIHAGGLVASGRGWAEVVAVAEQTELGQIGRSLATLQAPLTRLQRHTRRLTRRLTLVALTLCAALLLLQGGAVLILAVALALWPGLDLASRRSLVVALLVWSAGGLVWLNAAGRSALGPLALLISGLLWGVMQAWPALANLLALAPLDGALVPQLLGLAAVLLLLAFGLEQRRCASADLATGWSRCRVQ